MSDPIRQPGHDCLPESPVDWADIPLGPGQEPTPRGHLQFTKEGDPLRRTDVRRTPGEDTQVVVHRPPTWPV